jgi:hypothetical protein
MKKHLLVLAAFAALAQSAYGQEIKLNPAALEFARQLIRGGRAISDKKGAWRMDKPSPARENDCIRAYGFEEYAKWHLGIDNRHSLHSKSHFKFPFGDFTVVHRCGLLAVKVRAHEYGYAEIEAAADRLLAEIEINRTRH